MAFGPARGLLTTVGGVSIALAGMRPAVAAQPVHAETLAVPAAPSASDGIALAIDAPTVRGPWTMRVTNRGDVPAAIAADGLLLMLDVTPRGAHKPEHCELPSDMRPQNDLEHPLVLPPGRTYSEQFEPRLYCLGARRLEALAPGSIVVASLGWGGRGAKPPLEVSAIAGMEAQIAPRKSIVAPPISLPDEPTPAASQADARGGNAAVDLAWTMLALRTPASLDAASPGEIAIPVILRNDGNRAVLLRFGPETLAFEVIGPAGSDHCGWPASVSAPIRDLFTTVVPHAQVELTVMLSAFCARHALEKAGLLVVRASLDTREASGVDVGLRTFDGQVISSSPTVIRLRHGWLPRPLLRPKLDPVP